MFPLVVHCFISPHHTLQPWDRFPANYIRKVGSQPQVAVASEKHPLARHRLPLRGSDLMTRLSIRLLGPFQVILDGQPVTGFESDKVRALLAYLAVEAGQPHRRERLAGLLWPEWVERSARANLRGALANLRTVIGDHHATPPLLDITPQTIQLNRCSDIWVDVRALKELLADGPLQVGSRARDDSFDLQRTNRWENAIELYRGAFLEGFSLAGCPDFEEWLLLEQESLTHLAMDALCRLATWHEGRGNMDRALGYAQQQVELDPWWESGYQQIMRILAYSGKRAAALAQYETCRSRLAAGLGVEPSAETTQLYERIRRSEFDPEAKTKARTPLPEPAARLPAFLTSDVEPARYQPPVFVARDRELARLDGFLNRSTGGEGQVVFVTGGPGRGKTALLNEFTRRAMDQHPDLLVASGSCNAYSGAGDPYLPFREVLGMLTGDVESLWARGAIDQGHARRLWEVLPLIIQALLQHGPHVVPALVPGQTLLIRASAAAVHADHLSRLRERIEQSQAGTDGMEQSYLFQQVTNLFRALAEVHPLLLILDDLQWVDHASAGLLFHLGRRLEGTRILIVCSYRPEELAPRSDGERHPLDKVLAEFKRAFGDVWIDLAEVPESKGRYFVDALLETEPNHLGERFRRTLVERAEGHPLFTIELLRSMQERGDLVRDGGGRWIEGPALDWELLPARVEGVIGERIERLGEELRQILTVASVEGEDFTAEVVAQVQSLEARALVRRLSGELQWEHRLVRAQGLRQLDARRLALYRFQHHLFQKYLYNHLDQAERAYLHEDVGSVLEVLYGAQTDEVAVQLARHFLEARVSGKAAHYLGRAGEQAAERYANEEALAHLSQALELMPETDGAERYRVLLAREQVYDLLGQRDAQGQDLVELEALAQGLNAEQQAEVAVRRSKHAGITGDYPAALAAAQRAVDQARAAGHVGFQAEAHECWGQALTGPGDYAGARDQCEKAVTLARMAGLPRVEAHILTNLGRLSDALGDRPTVQSHYERALRLYRQASDRKGEQLALYRLGIFSLDSGDSAGAWVYFQQALGLAREIGFRQGEQSTLYCLGLLHSYLGDYARAGEYYEQALLIACEIGFRVREGYALVCLGDTCRRLSDYAKAREYLEQAWCIASEIGRPELESAALEFLGDLHRDLGDPVKAQHHYEQALHLNPEQALPLWSMPSLAGLARATLAQGDLAKAQAHTTEILAWLETASDVLQQGNPLRIHLSCYEVLRAASDPRANEILTAAYRLLQELAAQTPDEATRRSFLENVEENREIMRLAREVNLEV
jgi:adenylate cyclase